jgi:hypothetical protein
VAAVSRHVAAARAMSVCSSSTNSCIIPNPAASNRGSTLPATADVRTRV